MKEKKFRAWDRELKMMTKGRDLQWLLFNRNNSYSPNRVLYWLEYTSVEDKDGVEMCEGDIVEWKVGSIKCIGSVQYIHGCWYKGIPGHTMQALHSYQKSTKIVGHIFNPTDEYIEAGGTLNG